LRLSWPQISRGKGEIPFNHVCATRKTQFSNGSQRGFPFGRDLRRPTQTQSAFGVHVFNKLPVTVTRDRDRDRVRVLWAKHLWLGQFSLLEKICKFSIQIENSES
jgi:hypothetical protein